MDNITELNPHKIHNTIIPSPCVISAVSVDVVVDEVDDGTSAEVEGGIVMVTGMQLSHRCVFGSVRQK